MLSLVKFLYLFPVTSNVTRTNTLEENSDIISQLKFIAKIKAGEQINVDNLSISNRNVFSGIYRAMYGESRDKTFNYFTYTVKRAFEKVQAYMNSSRMSEKMLCIQIIENLYNCTDGLKNIKDTYKDDRRFVCDIETLIENIQSKLEELKSEKEDFFEIIYQRKMSKNEITL